MVEKWRAYCDRLPYSPWTLACFFALLTFLLRLPFIFRYDLYFGSDPAICYLMPIHILQGDRPYYFYGETHQGSTESYLTALLFKLFGPSIPLAGAQSLLFWVAAVGLGVYLLIRSTSKFHGLFAGLIVAIGVPYTLVYISVPYIGYPGSFFLTMLLLWQAYLILEKGPTGWKVFWFTFVVGTGLFVGKQCLPAVGAAVLALAFLQTPASSWRSFLKPFWVIPAAIGFLLGYWPEILYRCTHATYRDFSNLATPVGMFGNLKELRKALFAYFDAHPFSRIPTDLYFYHSIPYGGVHCAGPLDLLFAGLSLAVIAFAFVLLKNSFKEKNAGLFLLTALLFLNIIAVVISRESIQNIFNVRRYMHTSAITLSLLTSYLLTFYLLKARNKYWRGALVSLALLFPLRAAYHEYSYLRLPDGLRELRWAVQDMQRQGFNRGISHYGPCYSMSAISNEQVVIGCRDGDLIPNYPNLVSGAAKIAVIGYKGDPQEDWLSFNGHNYRRIGAPCLDELIQWTPFQRVK